MTDRDKELQGKVDAENISYVSPRGGPGQVKEIYVKKGDFVKKGQLLMEINPDVYKSEYERMVASVSQTKANLASAQARQTQQEAQLMMAENNYNMNK